MHNIFHVNLPILIFLFLTLKYINSFYEQFIDNKNIQMVMQL